jgi:malate permease and related proteins
VILAIAAGVVGRLAGLDGLLASSPVLSDVPTTLGLLGACTTPLIAIVIGYTTTLRPGALVRPAATIAVRLAVWIVLAVVFDKVVVEGVLGRDRLFGAAVMTMAVLPPPFVLPLFMGGGASRGGRLRH